MPFELGKLGNCRMSGKRHVLREPGGNLRTEMAQRTHPRWMRLDITGAELGPQRVAKVRRQLRVVGFERLAQARVVGIGIDGEPDSAVDPPLRAPFARKFRALAQMRKQALFEGVQGNHAQTADAAGAT